MNKNEIRLTQVYRINGRLVVANSIESAIVTWREWMSPNSPDIRQIERMGNNSYQTAGDDALIFAEGICGGYDCAEQIAELNEHVAHLEHQLKERTFERDELEKKVVNLKTELVSTGRVWLPTTEEIKAVYAAAGVMKQVNEHTDATTLDNLWEELKSIHQAYSTKVGDALRPADSPPVNPHPQSPIPIGTKRYMFSHEKV